MAIVLQEVLSRALQFNNGIYTDLPYSIKCLLDNLHFAYTRKNQDLFQKTLKALELHLVNIEAMNEVLTSQLSGKEDIHSTDKVTIMGTDYTKFSLKARTILKGATANLPSDLQTRILKSKAMNESRNLWYEHFKILVTTTIPNPDDSDDMDNILVQAEWEDYFGSSSRVYENRHPFPGLLVNYEDGTDEDERDPIVVFICFRSKG